MPSETGPKKPQKPRVSFYLDTDLILEIKVAAQKHRLSLGELAQRAFVRELQFLKRRPIKRLRKGLRRGRPLKLR